MPTPNANPHEVAAREKKAQAIADWVWNNLRPEQRVDAEILTLMRLCGQQMRDDAARMAGQRSPSPETWGRALQILSQRVKDARWGFDRGQDVRGAA